MNNIRAFHEKYKNRSPLDLLSTIKETELIRVKLQQNYDDGTSLKIEVPQHNNQDVETVFYCMDEFREAARRMELEGDELFTNYRLTLGADARTAWDSVIDEYPECTTAQFRSAFQDFLKTLLDDQARNNLLDYLRTTVKTRSLELKMLLQ